MGVGGAKVLVLTAWPLVLACPELKKLDLKGRRGQQAAYGTKLQTFSLGRLRESVSHAGSLRKAGGRWGAWQGTQWVSQKNRRTGRTG